jgi:hypothetical protein
MTSPTPSTLDRYAVIGALAVATQKVLRRVILPLCAAIILESAYLYFSGTPGAAAFALIGGGTCAALAIWNSRGLGLPLMPMMAVQSLVVYGIPIVAAHENIREYPPDFVLRGGTEVLVFNISMALAWWLGMQVFRPARAVSHALREFNSSGAGGLSRLGFLMLGSASLFQVLQGFDLMGVLYKVLPPGSDSILTSLVSVASACGLFLVSMVVGGNEASFVEKFLFWTLLVANGMMSSSDFLLATAAANLITVAIGLFWSNGRIPWRYLIVVMVVLSFLNTGKTSMRARYWANDDTPATQVTLEQLPAIYVEWGQASLNAVLENDTNKNSLTVEDKSKANKNQTLLDRIDNLQNLLFVIDAISSDHIKPLHGDTYAIIPPLLVPRILWPDKPRSHEGQVMLNVHFGRQDLESTFTTYIAWGLLPEAYGNFGPLAGSICLGLGLGFLFAWIENLTSRKLVVSMEGFLSLSLLMNLLNSFEMVASVLVTSTFQSFVIIIAASLPFVHRTVTRKPEPESEEPPGAPHEP